MAEGGRDQPRVRVVVSAGSRRVGCHSDKEGRKGRASGKKTWSADLDPAQKKKKKHAGGFSLGVFEEEKITSEILLIKLKLLKESLPRVSMGKSGF